MTTTRTRTTRTASALTALVLVTAACGGSDDADTSADDVGTAVDDASDAVDSAVDDVSDTVAEAVDGTSGGTTGETTDEGAGDGEPMKVGLVAPSASNDLAWTQAMVDSLDRVGEDRSIEVSVTDGAFVVEDAAAALRGYAEDGFDLVIAHGTQYGGPLQEIAPGFPDVSFAIGTSEDFFGLDNVFAYSVEAGQGGYVNGVMAAQLTASDNIGVVGPVPAGDAKLYIDGFVSGVAEQKPDATVNVNYIDSFSDVALASEAANALIGNGADVLTGSAQMVVGATGVAAEDGVPWFGSQSNQTELGPDVVVASVVYHWESLLNDVFDEIESGTPGGEALSISVAGGGLELEFNDGYDLDAAIRTSAEETIAGIGDGTIEVPPSE